MAKVIDVLKLPALRGITVAAGRRGLLRKVEDVTVMEVPDIKRWLKGNDFLITSFYSVRKSEEAQCRLIRELADTCSCLAVKTGQYVSALTGEVRQTADECGLPLLEIPFEMSYIDIIVAVTNLIFEEKNAKAATEKYVTDLIYGNYHDEETMKERGRLLGFETEDHYFAALNLAFRQEYTPKEQEEKALYFLGQTVCHHLAESSAVDKWCYISLKEMNLILIEGSDARAMGEHLNVSLSESYIENLWSAGTEHILCGIGPVRKGLKGIQDTYRLAGKAVKVGGRLYQNRILYYYEAIEEFCDLEDVLTLDHGRKMTRILEKIKNQELIDTLEMYFACQGSVDKVAERMFAHKNTVKYRLNRAQEQMGLDLKKPEDNFRIFLAVLALKMNR